MASLSTNSCDSSDLCKRRVVRFGRTYRSLSKSLSPSSLPCTMRTWRRRMLDSVNMLDGRTSPDKLRYTRNSSFLRAAESALVWTSEMPDKDSDRR
uniref:Uncharacterized protein n=1 Tax=Arundo donax TaxID=35708 RepID=A0A0A9HIB0_ARUDO